MMKNIVSKYKLILIFMCTITLCATSFFSNSFSYASANVSGFAQIKQSNTYLYKIIDHNENVKNKWCLLEPTYFVQIISRYNDDYFKVSYNGITGFVKQSDVQLVNEKPRNPYPTNIHFDLTNTNCYLRNSPKIKDVVNNILDIIPASTKNLNYIGKTIGEEAIDFKGTVWYLIEYNNKLGYVYSAYTSNITPIYPNAEQVTSKNYNLFNTINPITNPMVAFMIILILIPCLFIIILLYKPRNARVKIKHKHKEQLSPTDVTHMFDETDL